MRKNQILIPAVAALALFAAPLTISQARAADILPNWEQVEGNWNQFAGKVKQKWGKLTDDDLTVINGQRQELIGKVQERYGIAKAEAEKQVKDWERTELVKPKQ
ncbi:MAG: CsbD family protein [Ferrovibrio sp.]|nr:CsbD family protein [Ferrovibrio sp.]